MVYTGKNSGSVHSVKESLRFASAGECRRVSGRLQPFCCEEAVALYYGNSKIWSMLSVFETNYLVNASAIACCLAFYCIILVANIRKKNKTLLTMPFTIVSLSVIGQLLTGMAAWLYIPQMYDFHLYGLVTVLDFSIVYLCAMLIKWYFELYIYLLINPTAQKRKPISRKKITFTVLYSLAVLGLYASSLYNSWFFFLDVENCRVIYQPLYPLWLLLCAYWPAANAVQIIRNRKIIGKANTVMMLGHIVIPTVAFLIDYYDGMALGYVLSAISLFVLYIRIDLAQGERMLEQRAELAKAKEELADAKMELVMTQLRPHFLYNALSTISYLCTEDPEEAQKATMEFSEYLWNNLQEVDLKKPVPFRTELSNVENYLRIEKRRFPERLFVRWDILADDFLIPPMSLQILAENAIKHGVNKQYEPTTVKISAYQTETESIVKLEDNGPGFDPTAEQRDERRHLGLNSARFRLQEMLGGDLTIESCPNRGTRATIRIPKGENDEDSGCR